MKKTVYPLYYGGKQVGWGKGTVVEGARGFIFLGGAEGHDPERSDPWPNPEKAVIVEGIEAQTRLALQKIKSALEEMGSSVENIVKLVYYMVGSFPDGVARHPNYRKVAEVVGEFWAEHYPDYCRGRNPLPFDLIGVTALASKDMLIEIGCIAVLPDK